MDVSIFGKTLLNAAASRLRLPAQRGKVVLSGLGHLVGEAGVTQCGVRLLSAPKNQVVPGRGLHEEGQEALNMCPHIPRCPESTAPDREAAHTIASHPEQGWSLLCNGVVMFEDTGELLPNGVMIAPHRPTDHQAPAA